MSTAARATGAEGTRWYPCASDADLRVQVPERASARGVPRHERARTDELRGLRRGAARARPASGRRALQGLGLLLDRLRPGVAEGCEGRGWRLVLLGRRILLLVGLGLVVRLGLVVIVRLWFVERRRRSRLSYDRACPRAQPGPNVVVGSWGAERP